MLAACRRLPAVSEVAPNRRDVQRRNLAARNGADLLRAAIAGSRQTGTSGTHQIEILQIPVTLATLTQSMSYTRALRTLRRPKAGQDRCLAWRLGTGKKRRKAQTSLQQACKMPATSLQLWRCSGITTVLLRWRKGGTRASSACVGDVVEDCDKPKTIFAWKRRGVRLRLRIRRTARRALAHLNDSDFVDMPADG